MFGAGSQGVTPATDLGFSWIAFATLFAIGASYNISYAPYVSDYSRYLPKNTSRPKLIAAVFIGASLSGSWMIGLGAWLAQELKAADALVALNQVGSSMVPGLGNLLVIVSLQCHADVADRCRLDQQDHPDAPCPGAVDQRHQPDSVDLRAVDQR
jgi:purine-cytosine permease-like protein